MASNFDKSVGLCFLYYVSLSDGKGSLMGLPVSSLNLSSLPSRIRDSLPMREGGLEVRRPLHFGRAWGIFTLKCQFLTPYSHGTTYFYQMTEASGLSTENALYLSVKLKKKSPKKKKP